MTDLLAISLSAAVPLWIHRVKQAGRLEWEVRMKEKSGEWSTTLASHADVLMYRGYKPGRAAELFNMLAEALAHMAFVPGGVKLFGEHWEATFDG